MANFLFSLSRLPSQVGGRNAALLPLVRAGLREGLAPEALVAEIVAGSGTPPLSGAEVRRAVDTALRTSRAPLSSFRSPFRCPSQRPPKPQLPGGFVSRCMGRGDGARDFDDLRSLSPAPAPAGETDGERRDALRLFLCSLFAPAEALFIGERSGWEVRPRAEWERRLAGTPPDTWPPLIGSNPFTGRAERTADGARQSFRCKAAVAARRFALVEFDGMPLEAQVRFWAGVLRGAGRGALLPVAALVYSGGKSIHALLRVDCADAAAWAVFWNRLASFVCNPNDPASERADLACRDESRLTRLPGARRTESGRVQSLLYLAASDDPDGFQPEPPATPPAEEEEGHRT